MSESGWLQARCQLVLQMGWSLATATGGLIAVHSGGRGGVCLRSGPKWFVDIFDGVIEVEEAGLGYNGETDGRRDGGAWAGSGGPWGIVHVLFCTLEVHLEGWGLKGVWPARGWEEGLHSCYCN